MAKNDASSAAAATPAAQSSNAIAELVGMIQKAGPEAQSAMRHALGVGGAIQKPKPTQSNADVKRVAYSVGEVVHEEGFQPKVSEAVGQEGKAEAWLAAWNERNANPSSKAEELAATAHM